MPKLYFRHGPMDSAKTLNLLAVAHNYKSQDKKVMLLKPKLDNRFGESMIRTRAGLEAEADMLLEPTTVLDPKAFVGVDCVLVDEAQFLSAQVVEQLRGLTLRPGLPVICYGLRTDFATRLFEGSRRLLELADSIEEVKVTCNQCNRKAVFNMRLAADGSGTLSGAQVELGANDKYVPVCCACYDEKLGFKSMTTAPPSVQIP